MTERHRVDFLSGVRVLEFGDGVAGAAATSILWTLGAEVTAVVDASSPHRAARPRVPGGDGRRSLLSIGLDRGKQLEHVRDAGDLDELVGTGFDIVMVDRVLGARGALASLADAQSYVRFVDEHNRNAWLTISAFGLTGERADDVATELTVAAASGMLATVRDQTTGQPLKLAGQQSLLNSGQAGALAACHALDVASTEGPVHLDLSAVEATLATGPVLEVGSLLLNGGVFLGAKRYGAPASFYECRDGLVRISAMEDHQWQGVVAAMGSPAWAGRFSTVESRIDAADEVDAHVAEWARGRTKQEAESVLQAHGVPATAVYSPAEILGSPQLAHRSALEPLPVGDGREVQIVGLPFRVVDGGEDSAAHRRRRSLRGLRMLEASRVLAVPLAGAMLGALGVEVTKLEDLPRLDMYRRRGPYVDGEEGTERSAFFALMNHSKHSVAFDVDTDRDHLASLVRSVDVVIENLGRKRAVALGLAASVALSTNPDLLAISSTGFGQDGPHAEYRAYAYNLQASCALGYLTVNSDGQSAEIDIAWADLIAAYALATIIAAWAVGPAGNVGVGLDFAMADLVVAHFNDHLAAAGLDADAEASYERGNDLAPYALNDVYPTNDGWMALSVEDDEQLVMLAKVLGCEDGGFAAATRTRAGEGLATELRSAGIIAEQVVGAEALVESPQLASREFFVPVEHDEWGRRRLIGIPWRRYGGPPLPLRPPPRLVPREDKR